MKVQPDNEGGGKQSVPPSLEQLLTPKEAAKFLRVSESFLAKARMRGDGPAYIKVGRAVRYALARLREYGRARTRISTSEK